MKKQEKLTLQERIAKYLAAVPPAISGASGHNQTFSVACSLYNGWALTEAETLAWLKVYNAKCQPPWSDKELEHKAKDAAKAEHKKPRGHLLDSSIADQRAPPDWTIPINPIAAGRLPATLATLNSNLRARAYTADNQKELLEVIVHARGSENNVANVAKMNEQSLPGSKFDQNPLDNHNLGTLKAVDNVVRAAAKRNDPELVKVSPTQSASSPPPAAAQTASVPTMITHRMDADLRERGFSQDRINRMTPAEACEILRTAPSESASSGATLDVSPPAQAAATGPPGTPEFEAEAHRIADQLERLHQDGAIPNKSAQDPDASFYANLLHSFDATYIGKIGNVSSAVD